MLAIEAILGAGLLAFGRKLFWFFVAAVGFVTGLELATRFLQNSTELTKILVGLGAGIVGALLAIFLERLAIAVVGFIGGGFILTRLLDLLNVHIGVADWIIYVVGGIIGIVLIFFILDWMLIILSSLAGASMITEAFNLHALIGILVFVILLAAGIAIQSYTLRRERRHGKR